MKIKLKIMIYSLIILFQLLNCTSAKNDMSTFRADLKNSGVYNTKPVEKLNGIKWKFETKGEIHSTPAIYNGVLYFGSDDANFYALNIKDGTEKWRFRSEDRIRSSCTIANGVVCFYSWDEFLYCLDAKDGREIWRFEKYGDGWGGNGWESPIIVENIVYFGCGSTFQAIDIRTGQEIWKFHPQYWSTGYMGSPAYSDGSVYISSWDGNIYALDGKTGIEIWHFKTGNPKIFAIGGKELVSSPAVIDSIIIFGSWVGKFYAGSAKTGKDFDWIEVNDEIRSSPAVYKDTFYFGCDDGCLYAVNRGLDILWIFKTNYPIRSSPAKVSNFIYFGGLDGYLYALDIKTGEEKWKFKTNDEIYSSPIILDGVIYFGSTDGFMYAVY